MNKHEIYKLSIVRKYLSEDYEHINTPALLTYEQTESKDDLFNLLNEYLEDSPFLSVTILGRILGNIEGILESWVNDKDTLGLCYFFYDAIKDLRDAKYEEIEESYRQDMVLNTLLSKLGINRSN